MDTYGEFYTPPVDSGVAGGVVAAIFGVLLIVIIIAMIIGIITIIAEWKVFKKADQEGWKAIIPIYNLWVLCEIVGINPYWVLIICGAGFVSGLLSAIPVLGALISLAIAVVNVYFQVLLNISLARSFGKSDGFGVASIFFNPICMLILAFSNAEYVGAKPMNDVIFNAITQKKDDSVKPEQAKESKTEEKKEENKESDKKEEK